MNKILQKWNIREYSINKTDRHDITTELLLKVALNTITLILALSLKSVTDLVTMALSVLYKIQNK
jgi:hypothetical protein